MPKILIIDSKEIDFLKQIVIAQNQLLICYRLGGQPSEWVLTTLDKAKAMYGNLDNIDLHTLKKLPDADTEITGIPCSHVAPEGVCERCGEVVGE